MFGTLLFAPNIIRMVKSRQMMWAVLIAQMGRKVNAYRIFVGKSE
jgi:hypothetical protein